MRKKKILFVMNTMGRAGAERALIALINTLPKDTYDISLQVLIERGELFDEVPPYVHVLPKHPDPRSVLSIGGTFTIIKTILRCCLYNLYGIRLLPYLLSNIIQQKKSGRIKWDKLFWRLLALGRPSLNEQYDLAIAYLEGGSTYYVANKVTAKKKAAFVHIDYEKAGYTPELDLDSYTNIDRIFSVSKEAGDSFLRIYPEYTEKLFLFRNIIDRKHIIEQSNIPIDPSCPFANDTAAYRLLTVGRLHYQKAYDIAISTLRLLRDKGLDVNWYVLGEGALEKELLTQIKKEHLENHFFLLGSKKNPYPYYRHATLYIHATRFEGKSIAIEEAQVLGKAIIASDCTGNREQIRHNENGYLVSLDANTLAKAIEDLLLQPAKIKQFEQANQSVDFHHPEELNNLLELLS